MLRIAKWVSHLRLTMQHQPFARKTPDREDGYKMPDDGFLERAPGFLRMDENVGPEFAGRRGETERGKFRRRKKIGDVIEEGNVAWFEFEQQLETGICLYRNSCSSLRN